MPQALAQGSLALSRGQGRELQGTQGQAPTSRHTASSGRRALGSFTQATCLGVRLCGHRLSQGL